LAIGILEDFENTLSLFETMIPSVFAGATAVYSEIGAEISNQTATAHKTEISPQARSKLEKGKKMSITWQIM